MFLNPSLYAIGGMQAWLAHLMPDLRQRGWEVWLALPTGPHNDAAAYLSQYPWEPAALIDNPTRTRLGRLRSVQRTLARVDPDIVVVANIVAGYHAVEDLRARGCRAPRVVACVHTLDPGIFADLERLAHVIDGLVAPNRLIAAAGVELAHLPPERVFYAPYRVETKGPLPEVDSVAMGPLRLVFAHRLDHHQKRALDLPRLVAALARRSVDFRLDIVGSGPDEAALRTNLATHVSAGQVRFLGLIPPAELTSRALGPQSILLVLSSWEMGPIVAWQAMASGSPVVSSRYIGSGLEGVMRDGENALLFPVGDVEAATAQIARLADPALRGRLARCAHAGVEQHFSSEAAAGGWDRALREILRADELPKAPAVPRVAPAGRLDRWLGVVGAERVRQVLRWPVATSNAGDEWPSSEFGGLPRAELFSRLAALDGVALPMRDSD